MPVSAREEESPVSLSPEERQPPVPGSPGEEEPPSPRVTGEEEPLVPGSVPPFSPRPGARGAPLGSAVRPSLPRSDDGWIALARSEEAERRGLYQGTTWVSPPRLPS